LRFFTATDRYVFRLVLVPMLGVFALAASLLMLEKMLRLMEFVSTEGGPVTVVFKMLVNLIPEYAGLAIPLGSCSASCSLSASLPPPASST
jgi:lipopolysaccharide export system permease protein